MGCVPNCVAAAKMPKNDHTPFFGGKIAVFSKPLELQTISEVLKMF